MRTYLRHYPDYDYAIEGEHRVTDTDVVSLLVAQVEYPRIRQDLQPDIVYFSLLLVCVDEGRAEYKRVGMLEHDFALFAEKRTLTIL